MTLAFALIALLAVIVFFVSLLGGVIFKKNRGRRLKLYVPGSAAVFIACVVAVGILANGEAVTAGFLDAADKRAAETAGFTDPAAWKAQRDIRAEEQRKQAAAEAAQLAAEAEQKQAAQKAQTEADAKKRAAEAEVEAAAAKVKQDACLTDIRCIGEKGSVTAEVYCPRHIEALAKNSAEWTDKGFLDSKFSRYRLADTKGVVTYIGDKVTFQNGFGADVNMVYFCDVDVYAEKVISVDVEEGRLPVN